MSASPLSPNPAPHPRLWTSAAQWRALRAAPRHSLLRKASKVVAKQAARYLASRELDYQPTLHNSLLLRAREMQCRIWTLLVRWGQTGGADCRLAALAYVRDLCAWEYWGWEPWRAGNPDPLADFDLSYGENSATLALAYDWLHATLSEEERGLFRAAALKWSFRPFLAVTGKNPPLANTGWAKGWWLGRPDSNWNAVCAGGAGLLALALHGELPEAAEVLERADISLGPYMRSLEETGGGWPEGIGYWNYGHRYAFLYLLSHERATGTRHPLLALEGARKTLDFPLDFCPNGQPCSFGDVNKWHPIPFHYAAAARLRAREVAVRLDRHLARSFDSLAEDVWPSAAELLLFHPGAKTAPPPAKKRVCRLYPGLEWGILADRLPEPRLYLAVRGGTTEVPHSHLDLTSFHCVAGGERLIDNLGIDEYLDTTFSSRRWELFETTPASKNVLLINGVGISNPAKVAATRMQGKGWSAIRMEATQAMGITRQNLPAAVSYIRLFLLLDGPLGLILDRVELPHPGRLEARVHTFAKASISGARAVLRGKREQLRLAWACTVPSTLHKAEDALTKPGKSTLLRWCTDTREHTRVLMAMLLAPGAKQATVAVHSGPDDVKVLIRHGKRGKKLRFSPDLQRLLPGGK